MIEETKAKDAWTEAVACIEEVVMQKDIEYEEAKLKAQGKDGAAGLRELEIAKAHLKEHIQAMGETGNADFSYAQAIIGDLYNLFEENAKARLYGEPKKYHFTADELERCGNAVACLAEKTLQPSFTSCLGELAREGSKGALRAIARFAKMGGRHPFRDDAEAFLRKRRMEQGEKAREESERKEKELKGHPLGRFAKGFVKIFARKKAAVPEQKPRKLTA